MKFMNDVDDLTVKYHPLNFKRSSIVFEDKKLRVTSFPVKHRISCCGFMFQELSGDRHLNMQAIEAYKIPTSQRQNIKNGADWFQDDGTIVPNHLITLPPDTPRSYAFCTDTKFRKEIVPIIAGADLLYHEATFAADLEELAKKTFHTTSVQAAEIARMAQVKKLLIGHFSSRYKDVAPLVEEARTVFPETYAANDGDCFDL